MEEKEIFNEEELFQFLMKEEEHKMPSTEWWIKVYEEADRESSRSLKKTVARIKSGQAQTPLRAGTGIAATSGEEQEK